MAVRTGAWVAALVAGLALSGCISRGGSASDEVVPVAQPTAPAMGLAEAEATFAAVVGRIEPMAEALCQDIRRRADCDFLITIDDDPSQPANAYQTLDGNGRPVIVFNVALIADARNADEIAFILGHESAHHIAGHIPKTERNAQRGAILAGLLVSVAGGGADQIETAARVGATVGSRRYSQDYELEADQLGAEIAWRAGYDPLLGAAFFDRIPDPGESFLGTHPPNDERRQVVAETVARLEAGG